MDLSRIYLAVKFDRSVVVNLETISYFFGVYTTWFFDLPTIGAS